MIFSTSNESPEEQSVVSNSTSSNQSNGAVAEVKDGVEVVIAGVNGLSWVAVNDSTGATQFSGRIRQGESRSFNDNQLLYLVIGNAGAVQLKVNGEDLGVPGRVGEVVRLEFGPQASNNQG